MLVLMHLQQRQRPVHGGCADIAEQREDIVFIHQLQRVADCEIGLVLVVIRFDHDPSAVDAAGVVEWKQVGHCATIEFDAECPRTCRKIRRHAEADFALTSVAGRFVLRRGRITEERGGEQEGQREHTSRAEPGLRFLHHVPLLAKGKSRNASPLRLWRDT